MASMLKSIIFLMKANTPTVYLDSPICKYARTLKEAYNKSVNSLKGFLLRILRKKQTFDSMLCEKLRNGMKLVFLLQKKKFRVHCVS